jgi:hypothetical protein
MEALGMMQRVDLRRIWGHEERVFTPWLADNLALLSETIGVKLELVAREKNVGIFRADILAKDILSGGWVLIENQLERTDHCHLGQLLTYASGLKAVTIVWIASSFTEEHRAALDWLNEVTSEDVKFFGIEVELWSINNSSPAPKLNVISRPNAWSKSVAETKTSSDYAKEAEVRAILAREPGLSANAIARRIGCSPTTANKWKKQIEGRDELED